MKLKDARVYARVWLRLAKLQFETQIANSRAAATVFLVGKILRSVIFFVFISVVVGKAQSLAGYTLNEAIFILALFVWGGTLTQLVFRAVYSFRQKVQDGSFDFYLLSPIHPLFLSLFSVADPMDLLLMIPYTYIVGWTWSMTGYPITLAAIFIILISTMIMFAFAFAIHTLVIAIGVRYLEVDNLIMMFRDVEKMGTYPIDIYGKYVGSFLTYVIPVAIIATIPSKIIFGTLNPIVLIAFIILATLNVKFALFMWRKALSHYTSASS